MNGKVKQIVFWIVMGLTSFLFTVFTFFYYDLANGPLALFIIQLFINASWAAGTIFLVFQTKCKIWIKTLPSVGLAIITALLVSFAKPTVESKSAAYYKNPVKTEVLQLNNGKVRGVYNKDKTVQIYAGIPYAKPPVGDLRWKEPQDVENWDGVKECDYFAPKSMQPASSPVTSTLADIYSSKGWYPDYVMQPEQNMSENSLYLNIWRPNNNKTNLPIFVFIHGGSLTSGSSAYEDYNGEAMAKKDIVMITITYRLNVFGYFAHEQLINESSNHTTGNYGLLDQIKALEWVNQNASFFGGDKNNITIAGESAGSSSVSAICSSPLAKGLFKRAIGESSSVVVKKAPHTYRSMESALETGQKIMDEFKCSSIEELRKIPAKKLVNTKFTNSSMTLDGYALEKNPYDVYQDGNNNEESLLNGYNVLEADAFVIPQYLFSPTNKKNIKSRLVKDFGEDIGNKLYELYKDRIDKEAFDVYNEIFSIYWFIYPHHSWSNMALKNNVKVYRYQFTKKNNYHSTYHAGEMIYAYGNVKNCKYDYRYDDSDLELSETMLSYWSNFAKTENPNGEGLPNWKLYENETDDLMELGSHVGMIDDRYLKTYQLIEEYMDQQLLLENSEL